ISLASFLPLISLDVPSTAKRRTLFTEPLGAITSSLQRAAQTFRLLPRRRKTCPSWKRVRIVNSFPIRALFSSPLAIVLRDSSISRHSQSLTLNPRKYISFVKTPVLPQAESRYALRASLARAPVYPRNRDAEELRHFLDSKELAFLTALISVLCWRDAQRPTY